MKAIILSAGLGTRLKSSIPKSLVILKDKKTILDFQVENLSRIIDPKDIIIVVGHKKELIISRFPNLKYKENKDYRITNTSKSLLEGLKNLDEDIIWLNGDIYFEEKILDILLKKDGSCCLVNRNQCGSEEVKYSIDDNGFINGLSKNLVKSEGEALGINLIKKQDLQNFKRELEKVDENNYFEKALENFIVSKKLKLLPVFVGNLFCKEIDFQEDLIDVRNYLK